MFGRRLVRGVSACGSGEEGEEDDHLKEEEEEEEEEDKYD